MARIGAQHGTEQQLRLLTRIGRQIQPQLPADELAMALVLERPAAGLDQVVARAGLRCRLAGIGTGHTQRGLGHLSRQPGLGPVADHAAGGGAQRRPRMQLVMQFGVGTRR